MKLQTPCIPDVRMTKVPYVAKASGIRVLVCEQRSCDVRQRLPGRACNHSVPEDLETSLF